MEKGMNDKQAADFLGVKVSTLRKCRFEGRGPVYFKFGSRVVYYMDNLEAYRSAHRIEPRRV